MDTVNGSYHRHEPRATGRRSHMHEMNIEMLRTLSCAMPGTEEDVKWGNDLCFLVGKKMFCVTALDGPFRASFKVKPGAFEELVQRSDIVPAPYLARNNWVMARSPGALSNDEWELYIRGSYDLVRAGLPKRIREQL